MVHSKILAEYKFQSTPSARRATGNAVAKFNDFYISIHALREEGDILSWCIPNRRANFNPRPPRGGRPATLLQSSTISTFQSTPSARRATF